MFSADEIRKDFPVLERKIDGRPLIYLDNAATSQMPLQVMEALESQYRFHNANVHRGIHTLSNESTKALEDARRTAAAFIGALPEEIVFTSGTTDSVNMLAAAFREKMTGKDNVVVTVMEHHSNFVPWQMLCRHTGAEFRVCPLTDTGETDLKALKNLVDKNTRVVAAAQVGNVLGTINPVQEIAEISHAAGAFCAVDGAQGVRHGVTDVKKMNCDFYSFSGHKMLGPAGIGVLYGRKEIFDTFTPQRYGGGMVDTVIAAGTTFLESPAGWEAGTPNYPGAIGLAAAMDYLTGLGREEIAAREEMLCRMLAEGLSAAEGVTILGKPAKRTGAVSFVMEGIHPYDAAALLDKLGIAVRSGTHCAQPLLASLGLEHTLRVSPAFYNTEEEIERFFKGLEKIRSILQ